MTGKRKEKKRISLREFLRSDAAMRLMICILGSALLLALFEAAIVPMRYDLKVGMVPTSTIAASKDVVDEMREAGVKIGVVCLKCFRPFPVDAMREALRGARQVVVVERTLAVGSGGVLNRV